MSISVGQHLTFVAWDLHEDNNLFESHLWTPDEMIGYVNYAETDFLRRTGILKYDTTQVMAPGATILVTKPTGAMMIERISFNGKRLRRQTSWDMQRENPEWRNSASGPPRYWHEDHLPVDQLELDRIPAAGGSLRIFYDKIPVMHKLAPDGFLEFIAVPDCWEPYIRWEVLSQALTRDGDGQDVQRGHYAHQRYLLGVSLAKRFITGAALPAPAEA